MDNLDTLSLDLARAALLWLRLPEVMISANRVDPLVMSKLADELLPVLQSWMRTHTLGVASD